MFTENDCYKSALEAEIAYHKHYLETNKNLLKYYKDKKKGEDEAMVKLFTSFEDKAKEEIKISTEVLEALNNVVKEAKSTVRKDFNLPEEIEEDDIEQVMKNAVRCKKCKHFGKKMGDGLYYCKNEQNKEHGLCTAYGYCLYGEAKEEA